MATDKGKNAFAFVKDYLDQKKGSSFAEVRDAGKAAGHKIYPIVFGRAQLLLGHVKAGKKPAKKQVAKRGPGRPAKKVTAAAAAVAPMRRGPGRPPKAKAAALSGLDGLVQHVRGLERERDQLRATLEKLRGLIDAV